MTSRIWLERFFEKFEDDPDKYEGFFGGAWTDKVGEIMDKIGDNLNCNVVRRRPSETKRHDESGEYLGLDFVFLDKSDSVDWPSMLPRIIIEHENKRDKNYIAYCLWKLMCVKSPVKILICYQGKDVTAEELKRHLEEFLLRGNLMDTSSCELMVLIGVDSREESTWREYYDVYEYAGRSLRKIIS
ncbi:MAG: hypothetical protein KQH53_02360 [Desulfarculaceae bacterium]|nr:hypothetical protein [Desulfarculaceae bacterium]